MRDGRRNDCKACNLAYKAARQQENPQPVIERVQRWQRENRERHLATQRARRQRPDVKAKSRAEHLRKTFSLTPGEYDQMLAEQDGGCAICGREPRPGASLHVDHDHRSGRIRKLLCFSCNAAIGHLRDDRDRLQRVIAYLDEHDPQVVELRARAQERVAALRR
jgi:hypothetical protein